MKVDEIIAQLEAERHELVEGIEEQRAIRDSAKQRITTLAVELQRVNRLLRAAEGRKKGGGAQ